MDDPIEAEVKFRSPKTRTEVHVLFCRVSREQLTTTAEGASTSQFLVLHQVLSDLGYGISYTTETLTLDQLANIQVLVMGAPQHETEFEIVKQFIAKGGGVLLVTNAETMIDPPSTLNEIAGMVGLQFQEYHNYRPKFLQVFSPHYITANIHRVRIGSVASLSINNGAFPLGFTKATRQTIMACSTLERGRIVAIGDTGWFTDELLDGKDNRELAINTFRWLATRNTIDIEQVGIPETVKWGQTAIVSLQLCNPLTETRPQVECVLESDADAIIAEPARKSRSIPPGRTTHMQWSMQPQILGDQKLRLTIRIDGQSPLFFDQLSPMRCLAPGYFTLEIKDASGELRTIFKTGEFFTVEGVFHWATELEPPRYRLELQLDQGLVERSYEPGHGVERWRLQATAPGDHKLTLVLVETGQSLPVVVSVKSSAHDQLAEIKAAYLYPLDAEIAERLRQVDQSLSQSEVRNQIFWILSPEEFIKEVYTGEAASWLQGVLAAARREQWYNPNLLDLVLTYFAPTHLANLGSFIPYDPRLASRLAQLHPLDKRNLEYNFLCSEESDDISIKQNIAAYLLHEKYGHGFFYTQTRLGQQLRLLQRHEYSEESNESNRIDKRTVQLLKDSVVIVNEGFATWLELTFLAQLDPEIRQAVYPRQMFLIYEGSGLYERERDGVFFAAFPPQFDSRYREGFEYLSYIGRTFNLRCAVRAFLIATNIEFGIVEDTKGNIHLTVEVSEIQQRLLDPEKPNWRSHFRLREIAEFLLENNAEAQMLVRKRYCPEDCFESSCPLEALIAEKLQWRCV